MTRAAKPDILCMDRVPVTGMYRISDTGGMEYRREGEPDWTDCGDDTDVPPGDVYLFRVKAGGTTLASESQVVSLEGISRFHLTASLADSTAETYTIHYDVDAFDQTSLALYVGWYDENGRLLGVRQFRLELDSHGAASGEGTVPAGGSEYRLFLIDAVSCTPLTERVSLIP